MSDDTSRRQFLGAAAAVAALGASTSTVAAESTEREIVDDELGRRYEGFDYGYGIATEGAYTSLSLEMLPTTMDNREVGVSRYSDAIGLRVSTPLGTLNVSLDPEESAALRAQLAYAEQGVPPGGEE